MARFTAFARRFWQASAPRIRRADPLLMGAAIAYNTLFALVPLAVAFTAFLALLDQTDMAAAIVDWITDTFPEPVAVFLADVVDQSVASIEGRRGVVLLIALAIALWSGSRAVYAVQKALRTMQAAEDQRPYYVSRGLGIAVTVGASAGVFAVYAVFAFGFSRLLSSVEEVSGGFIGGTAVLSLALGLTAWAWLLLWAIYQWGPPNPVNRSWLAAGAASATLMVGSMLAVQVLPSIQSPVSVFGSLGVFLVWLYFIGIVVVAMPTIMYGLEAAFRDTTHR